MLWPGTQNSRLQELVTEVADHNPHLLLNLSKIDLGGIEKLVVVDTHSISRVTLDPSLLSRYHSKALEVFIYDHHPDSDADFETQVPENHIVIETGSASAIIALQIKAKGIPISPFEATIMAMGIHEDTGSFLFSSTSQQDFDAASFLLSQGMDVVSVSNYMHGDNLRGARNSPLSEEANNVYHQFLQSLKMFTIGDCELYTVVATSDAEVKNFSSVVDYVKEQQNAKAIFGIGIFPKNVLLVGRATERHYLNVGEVCRQFGGGGHACAASARISSSISTGIEVQERLIAIVMSVLGVGDKMSLTALMTAPAVTISSSSTIDEACQLLLTRNLKRIPVIATASNTASTTTTASAKCIGIIDRVIAEKAKAHKMGGQVVENFMETDFKSLRVDEPSSKALDILLTSRQRLVPITSSSSDADIVGVLSRADVVQVLMENPSRVPVVQKKKMNLKAMANERVPKDYYEFLVNAGILGEQLQCKVFLVGGFIRDLLLHRLNDDIDLVIEGNGIAYADALAEKFGMEKSQHHGQFLTAVVTLRSGLKIDVCTARLEYYPAPVALPVVELSSLKMDLYRRDFTINALAMQLNPTNFGDIFDFFDSVEDISRGNVSVIHSLSFIDDPTRIFRAIRFAKRYKFKISSQTDRLIKNALQLDIIAQLTGGRLFHEIEKILNDEQPVACWKKLHKYRILRAIHPALANKYSEQILENAIAAKDLFQMLQMKNTTLCLWRFYLLALTQKFNSTEIDELCFRFKIQQLDFLEIRQKYFEASKKLKKIFSEAFGNSTSTTSKSSSLPPPLSYRIYLALQPVASINESLLLLLYDTPTPSLERNHLLTYLTTHRDMAPSITGNDLKKLGLSPGPQFGKVLGKLKEAMIVGEVGIEKEAQEEYVKNLLGM